MKKYITLLAAAMCASICGAEVFKLSSPDGKLNAEIDVTNQFKITANIGGMPLVKGARVYMLTTRNRCYSGGPYSLDRRFYRGDSPSQDYNQLEFSYTNNGYKVYVRAYNDALAFRAELKAHPYVENIIDEVIEIPSRNEPSCCELPQMIRFDSLNSAAFVEACLDGYPKFNLHYDSKKKAFVSSFKKIKNDDEFESDYIYKIDGKARFLPWRAFTLAYGYADPRIKAIEDRLANDTSMKKIERKMLE